MILLFTKKLCFFYIDHDQLLLQKDLSSFYEWCRLWLLTLNPLKCKHLCISFKYIPPTFNYTLAGQHTALKPAIRYLGILINSHLKQGDHVKCLAAKATCSLNCFRHTLFSCPTYIKTVAYKSLFKPILEYASPVWCLHSSKDTSQLDSVQKHAARWVCRSRWISDTRSWSKSSVSCLQHLKWPLLHSRRSYYSVSLVHDILHK